VKASAPAAAPAGWARPRLVVSGGLEPKGRRAGGRLARAPLLRCLESFVDLVKVPPDAVSGPAACGTDAVADRFVGRPGDVDGVLLNGPPPSHVTGDSAPATDRRFPLAAVAYEGRLTDHRLRHHFLGRLFQTARLREIPATVEAVVDFHTASKLLLLAHSEEGMRALGRVAANGARLPGEVVKQEYVEGFARALARPARPGPIANALMHAFGHFARVLVASEKRLFLSLLQAYGGNRSPAEAPLALIRAWTARHGSAWVEAQSFLLPYPTALHDPGDAPVAPGSGEGENHAQP
jgi:uncharacterized protein YbgA (DUF1722 family)